MLRLFAPTGDAGVLWAAWLLLVAGSLTAPAQTAAKVSFSRDVAPILTQKCMQCHGKEPLMAHLDLRTREGALKGAQHGPVVVPGKAESSHLYRHLTGLELPQMPLGGRLSDAEIAIVKKWIDAGAEWDAGVTLGPGSLQTSAPEKKFTDQQRRYWAFQKVAKPAVPQVKDREWARNPIDAFVMAELESKNLRPNPPADKITLIRRATIDLTGLPPTPEEVQAFLADDLARRLREGRRPPARLAALWRALGPALARRRPLRRHRTASRADETRPNIWRYRDYVIQAFNDDKPYDRFIKEQIAGDELYPDDLDALHRHRLQPAFHRRDQSPRDLMLRRQETLNDITDTVTARPSSA